MDALNMRNVVEKRSQYGIALGSPGDPTRSCVPEETRASARNPWWAVRDSNPGPMGWEPARAGSYPSPGPRVVGLPRIGGLHHRYVWAEAA